VMPRAAIWRTARPWKAVVVISAAGVPALATSMASWRLHDVHDPQSAEPAKTTSQALATSAISSAAAGVDALAFRTCRTSLMP